MIDVVVTLVLDRGHLGPIYAVSRRGLLPQVHAASTGYAHTWAEADLPPDVLGLLRAIRAEIRCRRAAGPRLAGGGRLAAAGDTGHLAARAVGRARALPAPRAAVLGYPPASRRTPHRPRRRRRSGQRPAHRAGGPTRAHRDRARRAARSTLPDAAAARWPAGGRAGHQLHRTRGRRRAPERAADWPACWPVVWRVRMRCAWVWRPPPTADWWRQRLTRATRVQASGRCAAASCGKPRRCPTFGCRRPGPGGGAGRRARRRIARACASTLRLSGSRPTEGSP